MEYLTKENRETTLNDFEEVWEFEDIFLVEISRFLPKRDFYFTIEFVWGATLVLREIYNMSVIELTKSTL